MEITLSSNSNADVLPSASYNHKPMLAEGNFVRPVCVQRKLSKGWKMPENTIYVGRPSKWGNKYKIGTNFLGHELKDNADLVWAFDIYLSMNPDFVEKIKELKGKNLACFCNLDSKCHADSLLQIANSE